MKYFLFRDLDNNSNLYNGKTHHPCGVVDRIFNKEETYSGKDLSVTYFDPLETKINSCWRTYSEVELFEISKQEYIHHIKTYNLIEGLAF